MEKEICSLKELRDTMTATRHVNPTLDLWLDEAYDAFQCTDDLWVAGSIVPHVLDAVTIGNLTEAPREAECAAERRHGPRL